MDTALIGCSSGWMTAGWFSHFREPRRRNKWPIPAPKMSEFATLAPARGSLLDEGRNPLLRDVVDHIARHGLSGDLKGRRQPEFELAIEQRLARRYDARRLGHDRGRQPVDLGIEPVRCHATIDESALHGGGGIDE